MQPTTVLRFYVIAFACIALMSCAKPHREADCGFVQNVYGERVSWKQAGQVRLFLHNSIPAEFEASIRKAAQTWNQALGRTLLVIEANRVGGSPARDNANVIYYLSTWEADRSSEQARTSLYWTGDMIQEADIRINAQNYTFYATTQTAGAVSMEALILHELGHVLGLKHNDASPSVMATYLKSNQDRTQLQQTDSTSLRCEY